MDWLILVLAGLFEVGWAVGLKSTDGFTRLWPSLGTGLAMIVSFALLSVALKTLPLGTAYTVWTGIGAIGTIVVGIAVFGESASASRLACMGLIVAGIVGLKLVTPSRPPQAEQVVAESELKR
jgi:quaternary ammonium compound-resistance protein SugE